MQNYQSIESLLNLSANRWCW